MKLFCEIFEVMVNHCDIDYTAGPQITVAFLNIVPL